MDIDKFIGGDCCLLEELGWGNFVRSNGGNSDSGSLDFNHPAKCLIKNYKGHAALVKLWTKPWTLGRLQQALCLVITSQLTNTLTFS